MSQDLKVGDVCIVIPPAQQLVGEEVEIIGPEQNYRRTYSAPLLDLVVECFGFMVRAQSGRTFAIERRALRKKDEPGDFLPATEEFREDLKRLLKKPEHAGAELIFAGVATEPLISNYLFELGVMVIVGGTLITWLVLLVLDEVKARRAARDKLTDAYMKRGGKIARRRGWLPEDLQ